MSAVEWKVAVGESETTVVYEPGLRKSAEIPLFVCAHGAGGNMSDRGMLATASAFRDHGIDMVRFNFLYKERSSSRPDPMPLLMETTTAVVARVREELSPSRNGVNASHRCPTSCPRIESVVFVPRKTWRGSSG